MDRLLSVAPEDGLAHVQAGVTGRHLEELLAPHGLTMGHVPDSYELSTLGGWVATRASGMKRSRYGNIEDLVLGVRVVTAEGSVMERHAPVPAPSTDSPSQASAQAMGFPRVSHGVQVTDLLLGSEGTLGLVTSVVVKVRPVPERVEYLSFGLEDWQVGLRLMQQVLAAEQGLRELEERGAVTKVWRLQRRRPWGCSLMRSNARPRDGQVAALGPGWQPSAARLVDNAQFRLGHHLRPTPAGLDWLVSAMVPAIRAALPILSILPSLNPPGSHHIAHALPTACLLACRGDRVALG